MIRCSLYSFLLLFVTTIHAQTFSKVYDFGSSAERGWYMCAHPDGLMIQSKSNCPGGVVCGLYFVVSPDSGHVLNWVNHGDDTTNISPARGLDPVNGLYYSMSTFQNGSQINMMQLVLDEDLDLIRMSQYTEDDLQNQGYCQYVLNDKVYMLGWIVNPGAYTSPYLVCTDLEGNKLWSKIYTEYKNCKGAGDIIASHDGQLIMVERNAIPLQGDKAIIRKLDTLGNVIWKKIYGGDMSGDRLVNVCPLGSDKYLLQAHIDSVLVNPNTGGVTSRPATAFILDEDGELLSDTIINDYGELRYYTNTTCAKDGGVIASGGIVTGVSGLPSKYAQSFGLITRFDSLGNILWDRFFWDPDYLRINPDTIFSSAFGPVVEMDDGRLAVVGLINGPQDKGGTNPWVLMLDSVGCLTPGCGDGEQIVTALREPLPPSMYPVLITPNPASGEVTIGFDSPVLLDAVASVVITDMSGRQVLYNVWPRGQSSLQLGIPHLSSGMYVVRLEDARGQLLAVQKLVVPAR